MWYCASTERGMYVHKASAENPFRTEVAPRLRHVARLTFVPVAASVHSRRRRCLWTPACAGVAREGRASAAPDYASASSGLPLAGGQCRQCHILEMPAEAGIHAHARGPQRALGFHVRGGPRPPPDYASAPSGLPRGGSGAVRVLPLACAPFRASRPESIDVLVR